MDTYELLWKFWNNNVPKKYVAKELLSLGKPMEVYFAKEEFHTKPELTLMSKRNFDRIIDEDSDIACEVEYDEDFLKDLIFSSLGFKSLRKYDEAAYPISQADDILNFLKDLGINLIELDKVNPYGDFDDDDDEDFY